jgi:hypothetical protein
MRLAAAVIAASLLIACHSAPATPLFGTWRGTSLCTPVRPACHDEISVAHIAPSAVPGHVAVTMNKVVDGQEVEMGGTVDFEVDYTAHTLVWQMTARDGTRGEVRFTWSGDKMTGTFVELPGNEVIRNITLEKD